MDHFTEEPRKPYKKEYCPGCSRRVHDRFCSSCGFDIKKLFIEQTNKYEKDIKEYNEYRATDAAKELDRIFMKYEIHAASIHSIEGRELWDNLIGIEAKYGVSPENILQILSKNMKNDRTDHESAYGR